MSDHEVQPFRKMPRRELWYVFIDDAHQGPYTTEDIFLRLQQGTLSPQDHIWKEGLSTWLRIEELPAPLGQNVQRSASAATFPAPMRLRKMMEEQDARWESVIARKAPVLTPKKFSWREHRKLLGALALCTVALLAYPSFREHVLRTNDLPSAAQTFPEELRSLAEAQNRPANTKTLTLAISRHSSRTPSFFVAADLPDASAVEILVVGVPGTLIGKARFFARQELRIKNRLASSAPFTDIGAQPLPIGEYRVWARALTSDSKTLSASELLGQAHALKGKGARSYFLGSAQDETYRRQLKESLLALETESGLELQELEQYANTLQTQLTKISRLVSLAESNSTALSRARNVWQNSAPEWMALHRELVSTTAAWTADSVYRDFVNSELYLLTQNSVQALDRSVERFQISLRDGAPAPNRELSTQVETTRQGLAELRNRIETAKPDPLAVIRLPLSD